MLLSPSTPSIPQRVSYRPLQISKRSPYNTAPTSSHKRSVKVT